MLRRGVVQKTFLLAHRLRFLWVQCGPEPPGRHWHGPAGGVQRQRSDRPEPPVQLEGLSRVTQGWKASLCVLN